MSELHSIFTRILSPHKATHDQAEQDLDRLKATPNFVFSLVNYFNDPDVQARKMSAIIFKNTIIKDWNMNMFDKTALVNGLFDLILSSSDIIKPDLYAVMEYIVAKDYPEAEVLYAKAQQILNVAPEVALTFYIYASDTLILCGDKAEKVFLPLLPTCCQYLNHTNSVITYKAAKLLSHISAMFHTIPDFVCDPNIANNTIHSSLLILCQQGPEHDKSKKWAIKLMQDLVKRYLKYSDIKFGTSTRAQIDEQLILRSINVFFDTLRDNKNEEVQKNTLSYLNTVLKHGKQFYPIFEQNTFNLLDFMIPLFLFNEDEWDEPAKFLQNKYSDFLCDVKSYAENFFQDLMQKTTNPEVHSIILDRIIIMLNNYNINPAYDTAVIRYAGLNLFLMLSSNFEPDTHLGEKEEFRSQQFSALLQHKNITRHAFVMNYLIPDLSSQFDFLRSIALYALQVYALVLDPQADAHVFNAIVGNLDHAHEIVRTDALFSMQLYLDRKTQLAHYAPTLISKVLDAQAKYEIESLSGYLDQIIDKYSEEIALYAFELSKTQIHIILRNLDKVDDKLSQSTQCFETIGILINKLHDKKDILFAIYKEAYVLISQIVQCQIYDLLPEAIQLLSDFIFMLKGVYPSMFQLYNEIMCIEKDELICCIDELTFLIDNLLSFSQDNRIIDHILKFIGTIMIEEDFYEEDFIRACTIIESLILNRQANTLVPFFLDAATKHYAELDHEQPVFIYYLNTIAHCFIADYEQAFAVMKDKAKTEQFINDMYEVRENFKRVLDKKIVLMFISILLTKSGNVGSYDYARINAIMTETLKTLETAEKKKAALKISLEDSEDAETDSFDLAEDVGYDCVIDNYDVRGALRNAFSNLGTHGNQCLRVMTPKQKEVLGRELNL